MGSAKTQPKKKQCGEKFVNWLDVSGPPGVGKSTLCDPIWGPHDIPIKDTLPPAEWHDFLNEVTRLMGLVREHPTFTAAVRMNRRSVRKMAVVSGMDREKVDAPSGFAGPYIQTGFVQRGLGFGWRMADMVIDINELRHFFRLMPVSLGVAMLKCDAETVKGRNKARETVRETAHENRAHMVELMEPAIVLATECLTERGVPLVEIDTSGDIDTARSTLLDFAEKAGDAAPPRPGNQVPVLSPPVWW